MSPTPCPRIVSQYTLRAWPVSPKQALQVVLRKANYEAHTLQSLGDVVD